MSALTPERLSELRRIAEAATPGPWEVALGSGIAVCTQVVGWRDGKVVFVADCLPDDALDVAEPDHRPNLDYIATFDPPTVLALLDEVEQLITKCEELTEALESAVAWLREPHLMRYPDDTALARQLESALRAPGGGNGE